MTTTATNGATVADSTASMTPAQRRTLLALLTGTFIAAVDSAIVNVAAPVIARDLHLSTAELQLAIAAYTIAYAGLLILGARLGARLGYRRMFSAGLVVFTAASLLCGLATNEVGLVAGRTLQGVGAAALTPQVVTLIQLTFTGAARARALGWWATVISAGVVVGQIAGGALVSADLAGASWRPAFLVNLPIGVLALIWTRYLPASERGANRPLDPVGAVLVTGFVLSLIVPLLFGHDAGWPWWTWASLAGAPCLLAAAALHLNRRAGKGRDALIDPGLFRHRGFVAGLGAVVALMMAYGGFLLVVSLHLQGRVGFSPIRAGLTFSPYALGFAATSLTMPKLGAAAARRARVAGAWTLAGAYVVIGLLADGAGWPNVAEAVAFAVAGAAFGASYSPTITRAIAHVPPERAQDASGVTTTLLQIGFALGIATIGTWYVTADSTGAVAIALAAAGGLAALAALAIRAELGVARRPGPP